MALIDKKQLNKVLFTSITLITNSRGFSQGISKVGIKAMDTRKVRSSSCCGTIWLTRSVHNKVKSTKNIFFTNNFFLFVDESQIFFEITFI